MDSFGQGILVPFSGEKHLKLAGGKSGSSQTCANEFGGTCPHVPAPQDPGMGWNCHCSHRTCPFPNPIPIPYPVAALSCPPLPHSSLPFPYTTSPTILPALAMICRCIFPQITACLVWAYPTENGLDSCSRGSMATKNNFVKVPLSLNRTFLFYWFWLITSISRQND